MKNCALNFGQRKEVVDVHVAIVVIAIFSAKAQYLEIIYYAGQRKLME